MYKLYYANGSASMGVRVLLEEIGAPYELLDTSIDRDTPRPEGQLAVNPNGWVPVLLWDGGAMYEAAAITVFL
ncbi:MAG: glutathione S-transferase N-terminal domain-containing protein, partial [Pseudomonadota bacterium]